MCPGILATPTVKPCSWATFRYQRDSFIDGLVDDEYFARGCVPAPHRCQRCFGEEGGTALPLPRNLPGCSGVNAGSSWATMVRALRTPHCGRCGSISFSDDRGSFGAMRRIVLDAVASTTTVFNVALRPCSCCYAEVASDAIICVRCGTTSPRGGYVVTPSLERCQRCGVLVASDAGACFGCSTQNFRRSQSFFSLWPAAVDLRLFECPNCSHLLSSDALLCVHCGAVWLKHDKKETEGQGAASAQEEGSEECVFITAEEALGGIALPLSPHGLPGAHTVPPTRQPAAALGPQQLGPGHEADAAPGPRALSPLREFYAALQDIARSSDAAPEPQARALGDAMLGPVVTRPLRPRHQQTATRRRRSTRKKPTGGLGFALGRAENSDYETDSANELGVLHPALSCD